MVARAVLSDAVSRSCMAEEEGMEFYCYLSFTERNHGCHPARKLHKANDFISRKSSNTVVLSYSCILRFFQLVINDTVVQK